MTYEIILSRKAQKFVNKLNRYDRTTVERILLALSIEPRPRNCIKLTGSDLYRVKVGNRYRIMYSIHDKQLIVEVVDVGPRENFYKDV